MIPRCLPYLLALVRPTMTWDGVRFGSKGISNSVAEQDESWQPRVSPKSSSLWPIIFLHGSELQNNSRVPGCQISTRRTCSSHPSLLHLHSSIQELLAGVNQGLRPSTPGHVPEARGSPVHSRCRAERFLWARFLMALCSENKQCLSRSRVSRGFSSAAFWHCQETSVI